MAVGWFYTDSTVFTSAASFSSFLNGYSLFLGSLAGVILCDYWICRERRLRVSSLYDPRGLHYYTLGLNSRAIAAFLIGIVPNLPGLAAACGAKGVPKGATYLYSLSWLVSILISAGTYWVFWKLFPFPVDQEQGSVFIEGEAPREDSLLEEKQENKSSKV